MSYDQLAAKDAIVGVYPVVNAGLERPIAALKGAAHEAVPAHLDITGVRLAAVDGLLFRATFDLRGPARRGRSAIRSSKACRTDTHPRNIGTYARQLALRTPDGRLRPYNYGLSQIAHEMGHRWSAFASAKVGDATIPLGPTHWARGLHAPAAFPFQRPTEASAMGGGVWQDNFDGTFTQLDDDYYVPATGWSHLELYLMGLLRASEVPDFFILRNLSPAGQDAGGRPMFRAERTKITIQDVISAEGPRQPDVDRAQKQFNTGIVVIVERGRTPSRELIERASGIREAWIDYFSTTTGHRASMTATVPVRVTRNRTSGMIGNQQRR